jgi:hypothetical protein
MGYNEGREYVRTKLANLKRNKAKVSSNKTIANLNSKLAFAKGVMDEIKTHVPKKKKSRSSNSMNTFMGGYGSFGSSSRKGKKKGGFDPYSF